MIIKRRIKLIKMDGHLVVTLIGTLSLTWGIYILFFEKKI